MSEKLKYHYNITQGSDEWLSARLGIVTASEIGNLITPKGATCKNEKMRAYACQKAAERENKFLEDHFESFDMVRGHIQEEIARDIYSENFSSVTECGFITAEICGVKVGASPDGLIGEEGGVEIKSRLAKFQVKTILTGETPDEYMNQIQMLLLVTGREWFDFIQYSNGMPFFVKRVFPDLVRHTEISNAILAFESVVVGMQSEYKQLAESMVQTERIDMSDDDEISEGGA